MGMSLIGFGFGCPCILLLWMMRRACYMLSVPRKAALAGASYLAVMAGGLLALYRAHRMSLGSSIAVLDVSSLLAALGLAVALRPRFAGVSWPYLREVLTKHLHFGRWGVGTGVLYFISGQLFYITLATFDGLDASAALRAMINLLAPATLVSFGFASLLAPTLVAARQRGTFGRLVATAMSLLVPISLCYWIALALLAPAIFRLLYRGRYIEHAHLLWLLGASLVATSAIDILGAALRAREEPKEAFLAFAASATFALVAGTALTYMWGITGAVLSIVGAGAVAASVLARFYARRRSPADPDTTAS
jgi:O-antigen/teichoic acid export membrane protein